MPEKKRNFHLLKTIVLLLNLLVALGLLSAILASYIPPSEITLLSILSLLYPILLFCNIIFIVTWLILRSKWVFISLIVILLGFSNMFDNIQFSIGTVENSDSNTLKILTYNVQLFGMIEDKAAVKNNRNDVLRFIESENPTVTCLQEYYSEGITPYEPLERIKLDLSLKTYYYESYFSPRHNQLTGLVIFSKYPATGKGKLKFEGTRTFGIYTDLLIYDDTIRVYNIHLASIQLLPSDIDFVVNAGQDKSDGKYELASKIYTKLRDAFLLREKQMNYLVNQLQSSPYPVILCGDFNDTPSSYIYNQITSFLTDTFHDKGRGFSITYAGQIPFLRIDYIMKSEHFLTRSYQRHKVNFSDHYPVNASLSLK